MPETPEFLEFVNRAATRSGAAEDLAGKAIAALTAGSPELSTTAAVFLTFGMLELRNAEQETQLTLAAMKALWQEAEAFGARRERERAEAAQEAPRPAAQPAAQPLRLAASNGPPVPALHPHWPALRLAVSNG